MPLPIAGLVSGLFGGGAAAAPTPDNTTNTITTGAISFGAKNLGRGGVSSAETTASGGASVAAAPVNNTPLFVAAGVGVLVIALVLATRKT